VLRDARAVEPVIAALGDRDLYRDPEYRSAIAKALGKLGDARAIKALLSSVTDSQRSTSTLWDQRPLVDAATWALGKIDSPALGSPVGVEALSGLIANPADGIRSWAAAVLRDAGAVPATKALLTAYHRGQNK
jgi:PBS lyase HEAT-like repeat.